MQPAGYSTEHVFTGGNRSKACGKGAVAWRERSETGGGMGGLGGEGQGNHRTPAANALHRRIGRARLRRRILLRRNGRARYARVYNH